MQTYVRPHKTHYSSNNDRTSVGYQECLTQFSCWLPKYSPRSLFDVSLPTFRVPMWDLCLSKVHAEKVLARPKGMPKLYLRQNCGCSQWCAQNQKVWDVIKYGIFNHTSYASACWAINLWHTVFTYNRQVHCTYSSRRLWYKKGRISKPIQKHVGPLLGPQKL